MSRSIEIADSTYSQLEAAAGAEGTTPDKWLAARLPKQATSAQSTAAAGEEGESRTLYDRIKRIGSVSLPITDLADRHSEYFAEGMLEKYREGRL